MGAEKIRLAIIGMGKIARDQHLPALLQNDRFDIVAAVDPNASHPDLPTYPSLDALLTDGRPIDAVTIATPPQIREQVSICALEAGLHVFLEKPPASTVSGAIKIAHAVRNGRTLFTSWHSRAAPHVERARAWLDGRRVARGSIRWRESARRWHPGQHWLWKPGGLGVLDPAINAFSILTAITAERFSVGRMAFEVPENQHAPIGARGTLIGITGEIDLDLDFREEGEPHWDIELETIDGDLLLLSDGGHRLMINGKVAVGTPNGEYSRLYAHFAELIDRGESDVDLTPLQLVVDAFAMARITLTDRFEP